MDDITNAPENEIGRQQRILEKQYEIFFHIVRIGPWGYYDDHHYLSCMIQKKGADNYRNPLGVERVFLGIFTEKGRYTKDYQPFVTKEAFDLLARLVAKKYPLSDGDIVITHPYATSINVAQYPLKERLLKIFQEKLTSYFFLHYLTITSPLTSN